MSHVEAITGSQTSTFAFTQRLKITKSAQLITVTSCTYLSEGVYHTLKRQGLMTRNTSRNQETFGQIKSVYYTNKKPRGCRLETRVEAKKPSAKTKVYIMH